MIANTAETLHIRCILKEKGLCTENLFGPLFFSGCSCFHIPEVVVFIYHHHCYFRNLFKLLFQNMGRDPLYTYYKAYLPCYFTSFYKVLLSILIFLQLLRSLCVEFTTSSWLSATTAAFCSLYITTTSGHFFSGFQCAIKLFNHRDIS